MDEQTSRKPIPTISAETEILCNRIAKLAPGESVTYGELSRLIAGDVQGRHSHILISARRKAQRDSGVVTVTVRGEGIKRAMGRDYVGIASSMTERIRKAAKRALGGSLLMPESEYKALSQQEQVVLNLKRTMLGTVAHFASKNCEKKLEAAIVTNNSRLAVGAVLQLMAGKTE